MTSQGNPCMPYPVRLSRAVADLARVSLGYPQELVDGRSRWCRPWVSTHAARAVRRGFARCGLREMLGTAFRTVPERLGHPAFRRDRPDLPPQFRAIDSPSARRYREHGDRPDPPLRCRPRNPPCVTTLDAGPYVLPGLSWQTHTRSVGAPVIEVKKLARRVIVPAGCDPSLVRYAHTVGTHRWPGSPLLPWSAKVGRTPIALWSDMVVSHAVAQALGIHMDTKEKGGRAYETDGRGVVCCQAPR